jgi:hypothetical protein
MGIISWWVRLSPIVHRRITAVAAPWFQPSTDAEASARDEGNQARDLSMDTIYLLRRAVACIAIGLAMSCAGQPAAHTSTPAASPAPAVATGSPATAPSTPASPAAAFMQDFLAESKPMLQAGNYLGIVQFLEKKAKEPGLDSDTKDAIRQMAGTYVSFVGQYQEGLEYFAPPRPKPIDVDTAAFSRMINEDAVDAIAKLAANRQAVFINEAHHMPRHRTFTANLLPKLRALGFSYLAVETLSDADSALNTRGYPVRQSGFYSNEPVFGEMLRIALKLGFKLVPYEQESPTADGREQGQAQHLVDRILRADPKARIVVHAGYDHINESGTLAGAKTMAIRFHDMTGIDPLTVDQTTMTEQADTTLDDFRYRFLMKHVRRQMPFVLFSGDSVWSARPGVHDVTVISPRAVHRGGRPNWIWTMGGNVRRAYIASDEACPGSLDCVITARRVGESDDAVPVDILRVQFSAPGSKTFALPPGQYVIEARDGTGAPLSRQTITVK